MKTMTLFAAILFSIFSINTSTAQTAKTETIKVWGNCGMCKTTIEKSAKKAGAKTADWNEDSKELTVTYAVNKTSSEKIQKAIARSGYDTQDFTGDNNAYNNLHGCCKYDRKAEGSEKAKCCNNEKCGTGTEKCCSSGKCDKDAGGKDMKKCTDKACCKS